MEFGINVYHHAKEEKFKMVNNFKEKKGRPYMDSEGIPYEKQRCTAGKGPSMYYVRDHSYIT